MTAKHALRRVQALAIAGRVVFSRHGDEERLDEMASEEEIVEALIFSRSCLWNRDHETWNVDTRIDLTVAVVFDTTAAGEVVLVVTVFGRS